MNVESYAYSVVGGSNVREMCLNTILFRVNLAPRYIFLDKSLNSLFTVTKDDKKLGKIVGDKFQPYNYSIGQRSQDLEPLFYENGLLYITNAETIKQGFIISKDGYPYVVNHSFSKIDIDHLEDFEYAEYLYHKHKGN